jgi:hypothetical protein
MVIHPSYHLALRCIGGKTMSPPASLTSQSVHVLTWVRDLARLVLATETLRPGLARATDQPS